MTKPASATIAALRRAIRAADAEGKVAVQTPAGIAFVPPFAIPQSAPDPSEADTCAGKFGRQP